jgi:hypothetical protein
MFRDFCAWRVHQTQKSRNTVPWNKKEGYEALRTTGVIPLFREEPLRRFYGAVLRRIKSPQHSPFRISLISQISGEVFLFSVFLFSGY